MTTLERVQAAQAEPPTCDKCPEMVRAKKACFCGVSGKMLLPSIMDFSTCNGERLKYENGEWRRKE